MRRFLRYTTYTIVTSRSHRYATTPLLLAPHAPELSGPISHTSVMSSSAGLTWVDVSGAMPTPSYIGAEDPFLSDSAFVMAMRSTLVSYAVPEHLISEISRVVLLPLTVIAHRVDSAADEKKDSKKDVCFVCRHARIQGHEQPVKSTVETARQEIEEKVTKGKHLREQRSFLRSFYTPKKTLLAEAKARHKGAIEVNRSSSTEDGMTVETIQQLSYRLTVFILPRHNMVVTVHRYNIRSIELLKKEWIRKMRKVTMDGLLRKLVIDCAQSYLDMERVRAAEVDRLEERLFASAPATASNVDKIRHALFHKPNDTFKESLETLYSFSREASAYCRVLQPLLRAYNEARIASQGNTKNIDLVEHRVAAAVSMCEGLREQTQSLLSLQFSVGASQLEELMRLLTVFSTIFIPLEFVASVGGADVAPIKGVLENNSTSMVWTGVVFGCVLAVTGLWLRVMPI